MIRSTTFATWRYAAFALLMLGVVLVGSSIAGAPAPAITLRDVTTGMVIVPYNNPTAVNFGSTAPGAPATRTFTVTNSGTANLTVSDIINFSGTGASAFTVMTSTGNGPTVTVLPGQMVSFSIALNGINPGTYTAQVSFANNTATANPWLLNVTGVITSTGGPTGPVYKVIDDSSPTGFTTVGNWTSGYAEAPRPPYQGGLTWANPGTGSETASWTFTGLTPGQQYQAAISYRGHADWGATNTPVTIHGATSAPSPILVNQTEDPTDFSDGGRPWKNLGTFTPTGTSLEVRMSNQVTPGRYPNADAARIVRVGAAGGIIDDSGPGFTTTGTWFPGYTETGLDFQGSLTWANPGTGSDVATWTFTGLAPGAYNFAGSWRGFVWGSLTPIQIFDNTTPIGSPILVNQTVNSNDFSDAGTGWKNLGTFTINSGTAIVRMTNNVAPNTYPNADAMRIETAGGTVSGVSMPDAFRLGEQATWGPTDALVAQIRATTINDWLNAQFAAAMSPYPTLPLYNTNDNVTNNNTTSCYGDPTVTGNPARTACLRDNYQMYPLQNLFYAYGMYNNDQLRQRMTWALYKVNVISGIDIRLTSWVAPYLQILQNNAFGNYRTLMRQVTFNPGMGNYLDMAGSTTTNPNENYPRELLQLFYVGLDELHPNGTLKLDGLGNRISTYDQNIVNNYTEVTTGWNLAPAIAAGIPDYINPMRLGGAATENPVNHNFTSKTLMRGQVIPARTSSVANAYLDVDDMLNGLRDHPTSAPFMAKQFIQQLVTSNPSPGYVARISKVWWEQRTSSNQLREVVRAILLDPEARGDVKTDPNYGKMREPAQYIMNLMRLYDAKSADRTQNSDGYLNPDTNNIAQNVWNAPTVFSYFSPDNAISSSPLLYGPEFQIYTTTTAFRRANFINQMTPPNNGRTVEVVRAAGTTPAGVYPPGHPLVGQPLIPTGPLGTAVTIDHLLPLAGNPDALLDELNRTMLHGTMTTEMRNSIRTAINAVATSNPRKRVKTGVYLIASSSQYQVQR